MPNEQYGNVFPYATYREYVSALSTTDSAFQRLGHFLATSPDASYGPHIHNDTQVPRCGSVTIGDCIDGKLASQEFPIGFGNSRKHASKCITALVERPSISETRLILLSYHRDPFTGEYTGVNTDVVDVVGKKFGVHPEVLMWHFGSDYGLDKRFFLYAKPPIPSALSNQKFFHLQNDHSLFSCCLYGSKDIGKPDTVIMFARNHEFPNWDLLMSRVIFLESSMPLPSATQQTTSRWSKDIFLKATNHLTAEDIAVNITNPIEFVISYAQMILINATFVMDMWELKVMHPHGKTSANLEVHYDKQVGKLNEIQLNFNALRTFTSEKSSARWKNMVTDYERVLHSAEQQINVVLAQKMTYRAAMASLDESRIGIEHARRGMEQNARLKRLTQLAFVFIPLSFSTSIFGMNLEILGTGSAKAWMVFIAIALAYTATSLLWVLIDYQNVKAALTACVPQDMWPLRFPDSEYDQELRGARA